MTDAVSALAEQLAEDLCLGFRWHDRRERERAVDAFARVDVHQFPHVPASEAREAARAYVDALWAKDALEGECVPAGADEPDYDRLADADWSRVRDEFQRRATLIGIDDVYADASTTAWKRHKIGGDYWTPMLRAQTAELRAAMQTPEYPEKPHEGTSGFGAEAVRYLLGVELHDQHTAAHWTQAQVVMESYFERILRSHDHHRPPVEQRGDNEHEAVSEPELVTDGGTAGSKSRLRCGDRVRDLGNEDDDAHVYVVEQLDEPIDEYVLYTTDHGTEQTVYDYTRGDYDADEPVVRVVFENSIEAFLDDSTLVREEILEICHDLDVEKLDTRWGFLKVYAYPRGRLGEPDRAVATDGGTEEPPIDLDFESVEDLSDEELVEQHRTLAEYFYENAYRPHLVDWHEDVQHRTDATWREIKDRAGTVEPTCPECGGRNWGQVPGDPVYCRECGYEARRNDEMAVHDAWDAMFEEVGSGA